MSSSSVCRAVFTVFVLITVVVSFNLEPRIPVVKIGSPKSHFGFSVAEHRSVLQGSSRKVYKPWILVGAPKDHNLQPGTHRSGALWKCPITTNSSDCVQVYTDGFKDANGKLLPPNDDEIKDDQWLGVTVKSQGTGGDVLVCAHRYRHKGRGFQWGFGLCYLLDQNLDVADSMEPCKGKAVAKEHQQYGFCQAGISGMLLEDEVVLGVPGPYTWRGTVHTSNISKDFLLKDKTQYFGPVTENESPVDKYSYLGYSVTAGRFLGDFVSYVGGAPRSNGTGQVVFFSRDRIGESLLLVDLILDGEMFASSYGFEVLAVDLDSDKYDDLIVGAPFYYTPHSSGAIYVYVNRDGIRKDSKYTKIEGPPGESRFGFSMTSLGDLNLDGFQDIAVGAPYEDRGAIYIYLGSKDGLVIEPSQVIRPSDLPGPEYDAFGYALSGGVDMDNNGYPDLLTSSFCSDRVVLIRARPVINIETIVLTETGLKNIDPSRAGCHDDPGASETCFSFDACFLMNTLEEKTRTGLLLQYTIEERPYKDQPLPRIHFKQDADEKPMKVVRKINLRPKDIGQHLCNREIAYLRHDSRDLLRPIRFKLSYEIIQRDPEPVREGGPMPNVDDFPILDQQEAVKYFQGDFIKDCGSDDICDSDLQTEARLRLPWDNAKHHQVFELGNVSVAILETSVSNVGEPAYEPNLYIKHHESMSFSIKDSDTGGYLCVPSNSKLVHCSLDNPLVNGTGPMFLAFKPSGFFNKRFIKFIVFANSTSNEVTPEPPIELLLEILKRAEISIVGSVQPEQVFFSGDVVGESAVENVEQIGSEVIHKYLVDNRGPWRVDYLDVEILWPYQVENFQPQGKWLLYLTETPTVDGDGECVVDPQYINPVGLTGTQLPNRGYFGGVQGEVEVTKYDESATTPAPYYEDEDLVSGGSSSSSSSSTTFTNRTTTVNKKITSSSTINKVKTESSKSSKDSAVRGSLSSSSSSINRSHGSDDDEYDYYDYEDYPEEHDDDNKRSGSASSVSRTHSRVSRKVYNREETRGSGNTFEPSDNEGSFSSSSSSTRVVSHSSSGSGDSNQNWDNELDSQGRGSRAGTHSAYDYSSRRQNANNIGESEYERRPFENKVTSSSSFKRTQTSRVATSEDTDGLDDKFNTLVSSNSNDRHFDGSRGRDFDGSRGRDFDGSRGRDFDGSRGRDFDVSRGRDFDGSRGRDFDGSSGRYFDGPRGREFDGPRGRKFDSSRQGAFDGSRHSTFDSSSRDFSDRSGNNDRDSGWESRTYDEGRGREDKRQSSRAYFDNDGSHVTEKKSEVHHSYVDNNVDPNSNFRTGDISSIQRSKKVYSTQANYDVNRSNRIDSTRAIDNSDRRSGYESSSTYPAGQYDPSRDRENDGTSVQRSYTSHTSRSNFRTSDNLGNQQGSQSSVHSGNYPSQNSELHSSRQYNQRNTKTFKNDGSRYESENPSDTDTSSHSSWRSSSSSRYEGANAEDSPNSRWSSGGFRTEHNERPREERRHRVTTQYHGGDHSGGRSRYDEGGRTFARAEVDANTGESHVFSKQVYDDHSSNWQQVDDSRPEYTKERHFSGSDGILQHTVHRVKRDSDMVVEPEAYTDAQTGKTLQVVNLRCTGDVPTAKCVPIRCSLRNLGAKSSATIRVLSRLWNATLVEDYSHVNLVNIQSRGEIILPEDLRSLQDESDDVATVETKAYANLLEQSKPVPLWVILLAIFAGLLLLALIILIMWKCGFFKRKRPGGGKGY